jgi:hypothetical protein
MKKSVIASLIIITMLLITGSCKKDKMLNLIPFKLNDKWGYMDKHGKYLINPQFREAHLFMEGLALVKSNDDKYGFITPDGKYKINPIYKNAQNFYEGLACVVMENSYPQFIDKNGKVIISLNNVQECGRFSEGLASVKINGKWGFIDKIGNIKIKPVFDYSIRFQEGLCQVTIKNKKQNIDKIGFIDKKGEMIINLQFTGCDTAVFSEFSNVSGIVFSEGLAAVSVDGKEYGYIDNAGQYKINPQFSKAYRFYGGLALVKYENQFGYIDKNGKYIINPQFVNANSFSENGLAAVQNSDTRWGFINSDGKYVITPQFESVVGGFHEGLACVKISGKYGLIDEKGNIIVNPQFDAVNMNDLYFWSKLSSDYIDSTRIAKELLKGLTDSSFYNQNSNIKLSSILKKYTDSSKFEMNEHYLYIKNDSMIYDPFRKGGEFYYFDNYCYLNIPVYKNSYESVYGYKLKIPRLDHYKKKINNEIKIRNVDIPLFLTISGDDKLSKINHALIEELKSMKFIFITESSDNKEKENTLFKSATGALFVGLKKEEKWISLELWFNKNYPKNYKLENVLINEMKLTIND